MAGGLAAGFVDLVDNVHAHTQTGTGARAFDQLLPQRHAGEAPSSQARVTCGKTRCSIGLCLEQRRVKPAQYAVSRAVCGLAGRRTGGRSASCSGGCRRSDGWTGAAADLQHPPRHPFRPAQTQSAICRRTAPVFCRVHHTSADAVRRRP